MRHMQNVPWQLKIAAKIVLARLPLPYHFWEKIGLFKQGGMDRPEYALRIFRRHFDAASLTGKADGFVGLELGPGDSLDSALIARTFGASKTFLVDVESCASTDLTVYREMESHLRQLGMYPPNLDHCRTIDDVADSCGAEYLTEGLTSLRKIPSASVDFVWSNAVLPYVRRNQFVATLRELRRVQRAGGVASHCVPIRDIIGGKLNDLRFSEGIWESPLWRTPVSTRTACGIQTSCGSFGRLDSSRKSCANCSGRRCRRPDEKWPNNLPRSQRKI